LDGGIGLGQSRARGLTRAILDTFPVVKFGGTAGTQDDHDATEHSKDVESRPDSGGPRDSTMEMKDWQVVDVPMDTNGHADDEEEEQHSVTYHTPVGSGDEMDNGDAQDGQPRASGSRMSASAIPSSPSDLARQSVGTRPPNTLGKSKDVVPAAIGRETCPICIVDFEEGDDVRLLPCEGKHKFHQECVDPWLLELSSSCPICRQDFQALETLLSGERDDASYSPHATEYPPTIHMPPGSGSPTQSQGNRFSRYLRFARRRRNHRDGDSDIQENDHSRRHTNMSRHSSEDNPM